MNLFEELLKEARKRARLSQQALADKVGVDDSYISKMENGVDKRPSREKAVKLADALGLRKKSRRRLEFLLAAGVTSEEDLEGFALIEVPGEEALGGVQPALAGAFGSGVGLGAILARYRTGQQQTESASQHRDQTIGFLVDQTLDEAQLTPEARMLARRLILENARSVCEVLAKEQDQQRR
jgi:transcriptional regulator with XRE-family HTH domain